MATFQAVSVGRRRLKERLIYTVVVHGPMLSYEVKITSTPGALLLPFAAKRTGVKPRTLGHRSSGVLKETLYEVAMAAITA